MHSNFAKKFFLAIIIIVSFSVGYFLGTNKNNSQKEIQNANSFNEIRQEGYKFINPLLECETGSLGLGNVSFESEIKKEIENGMKNNFPNTAYSVYFRNLKNGPWFGINENENFSPASLLKVPIMMAYFKQSEKDQGILDRKIFYQGVETMFNQKVDPEKHIEAGKEYSVIELIERMIIYSDNEALLLLYQGMDKNYLNNVYTDLGIQMPDMTNAENMMTVKEYASFFRILYNASYLHRELSEKALEILSRVDYDDGIKAGIENNILVAHKFGERESRVNGGIVSQLHDCGIVYDEKYPYLLCVMTRGKNIQELAPSIKFISKIIFDKIEEK